MPPMPTSTQRRGPTWFDKLKMGALMGGTVGGIMGFIYGTVTIFQYGAGTAGVMRTLSKYMVGSGSLFAVMMGVGSVIRTDTPAVGYELWAQQRQTALIHSRLSPQSRDWQRRARLDARR